MQDESEKNKAINIIINISRHLNRKEKYHQTLNLPSSFGTEVKSKVLKNPDLQPVPWCGSHGELQKRYNKM